MHYCTGFHEPPGHLHCRDVEPGWCLKMRTVGGSHLKGGVYRIPPPHQEGGFTRILKNREGGVCGRPPSSLLRSRHYYTGFHELPGLLHRRSDRIGVPPENENCGWIPLERGRGIPDTSPPPGRGVTWILKKRGGGVCGRPPYIFLSTAARFRKYQNRSSTRNPAFSRNDRFSENSFPETITSGSV